MTVDDLRTELDRYPGAMQVYFTVGGVSHPIVLVADRKLTSTLHAVTLRSAIDEAPQRA